MRGILNGAALLAVAACVLGAQDQTPLNVAAGKSIVVDSPVDIKRVSVSNPDVLEAVGISPREVLINGKLGGEATLVIWQEDGDRRLYNVSVHQANTLLDTVRHELARELPGQDVSVDVDKDVVFLHGTVNDLISSNRAVAIAATMGKTVNLLNVNMPPGDEQILLKVKFADVDRTRSSNLGINLFSTGATNTIGGITTQQFSPPALSVQGNGKATSVETTLSNALNIFLYRPDLNLGATIAALEAKNVLQILAEPNVLAINGKEASFLAGGEFPYPTVQGGSTGGALAITIQFKEFGVRLRFTPTITPRGTIRLVVAPEVSSLDYSNGLTYQGFSIPALSTRKVQTEIELESGQSFAIAGLLDNRVTEILSKVPGLGDIPLLGKLFQSRQDNKTNSELLIMVTPELVHPIPAGAPRPEVNFPKPFLDGTSKEAPHTPGIDVTGPAPVKTAVRTVPVETLLDDQQRGRGPVSSAPQQQQAPVEAPAPAQPAAPAPQQTAPPAAPSHNSSGAERAASVRQPVTVHDQAAQVPYETIPMRNRELALNQPAPLVIRNR